MFGWMRLILIWADLVSIIFGGGLFGESLFIDGGLEGTEVGFVLAVINRRKGVSLGQGESLIVVGMFDKVFKRGILWVFFQVKVLFVVVVVGFYWVDRVGEHLVGDVVDFLQYDCKCFIDRIELRQVVLPQTQLVVLSYGYHYKDNHRHQIVHLVTNHFQHIMVQIVILFGCQYSVGKCYQLLQVFYHVG